MYITIFSWKGVGAILGGIVSIVCVIMVGLVSSDCVSCLDGVMVGGNDSLNFVTVGGDPPSILGDVEGWDAERCSC